MHYLIIENALPPALLEALRLAIAAGPFDDGQASAGGLAQAVKRNLQLAPSQHGGLLERIAEALGQLPGLQAFALPRQMGRSIVNRYEAGMAYGLHSDGAYIGGLRTDVSYTLFLDDPAGYDGGELQIISQGQTFNFKLPAGSLLLYPTGNLHQVLPVTRGVRHAAVGWIQSRIRDAEQRELIAKLQAVPLHLGEDARYQALAVQTNECIQRLIRLWGE